MKNANWRNTLTTVCVILIPLIACGCNLSLALERPYSNPPLTFQDSALAGTWETRYWTDVSDILMIRGDGTFKQVYQNTGNGYIYETPWNKWTTEPFADGRLHLILSGARYYAGGGTLFAERDGLRPPPGDQPNYWKARGDPPFIFYDPVSKKSIQMVGKLVVNIRSDASGELVLMHMWTSGDRGFALLGGDSEEFRRVVP